MNRTRPRVGFVTGSAATRDGWGRYTVGLVREMQAHGIDAVLVTSDATLDGALAGIEHHPILPPLFRRRFEVPRSLLFAPALRRVLATCDLVHGLVEPYLPLAAMSTPRDVPLVQTAHGTWAIRPFETLARKMVFSLALSRVNLLVFQSHFTYDLMSRRVPLPPHVVWPGGVRIEDFDAAQVVELPDWSSRGPVVLSVGAMKARKGHHVALEALALARDSIPGLQWVVIGADGASQRYRESLRARAAALGVADDVHLLGRRPFAELAAWYRRADVFLLLPITRDSQVEGLGLVYLEAAAAGTPSIGTRDSGAAEAIVDGRTGLLVPQEDARATAAALMRLCRDAGARAAMGEEARRRACVLSWFGLAGQLACGYADLLGRPRPHAEASA